MDLGCNVGCFYCGGRGVRLGLCDYIDIRMSCEVDGTSVGLWFIFYECCDDGRDVGIASFSMLHETFFGRNYHFF